MANFDLESYAPVQERIAQFYKDHEGGSIRTFLLPGTGPEVIFEARVYRTVEEAKAGVYTSGFAREIEGAGHVNKTSHVENCETSAVGRALANMGYATDARRPSRNEMLKVARQEREHESMISYIKDGSVALGDGARGEIDGEEVNVQQYVKKHWAEIKARHSTAFRVVGLLESAGAITYRGVEEVAA